MLSAMTFPRDQRYDKPPPPPVIRAHFQVKVEGDVVMMRVFDEC